MTHTFNLNRLLSWLALACVLALALLTSGARAGTAERFDENYSAPGGAPFFLLTDTSYGSQEEAQVRLEVASHDLGAFDEAAGVDIALYRVADPLSFLKQQKSLHRIDLQAKAQAQDVSNSLSFLWDSAWRKARNLWQSLFSPAVRKQATQQAPQLAASPDQDKGPSYQFGPAYTAPAGMQAQKRFRYPLQYAKPIAPPKDLKLAGSSSEFIPRVEGNVMIPLGQQAPGLYVVEAAIGKHRAVALLFVSDTVAISKTAQNQMLVWVAQRAGGLPASAADVVWSDLNGVLASGQTDAHGVVRFNHAAPQTSYVFGKDAAGGVFVSENFYFDSEIYNNKLYATTDRPLYRPGDVVNIKLYGREFQSATRSQPMTAGQLGVQVLDAQGSVINQASVSYASDVGGQHQFTLPDNAPAGGYEIRVKRGDDEYSAAFRVAQYVKPHFEILVEPAKPSFKTDEAVQGSIRLAYPDGKPVANARVSLSARAQLLTMVEGDLAYGGTFPLQIDKNQDLVTDSKGVAQFTLPAAKEPSRLILTVLATDGAAQRVRSTKELLIERSASAYSFKPAQQFAAPNTAVNWQLSLVDAGAAATNLVSTSVPTHWVAIHQESQTRVEGAVPAKASSVQLSLQRPGSYTVQLQDAAGQILGAGSFWVSGGELKPPQGSIEVVFDKTSYAPGEKARALITFPVAVDDALLTLERDSVEAYARLMAPGAVGSVRKLNATQWEFTLGVVPDFAPNITFSVAYVKGREFGFQNAGIAIARAQVELTLKTDKPSYQPGETVTVDVTTLSSGKPVSAVLSLGAVDELVYVLQPELAPSINEFFYHPRRNNVRTHASLAFISYDEGVNPQSSLPQSRNVQERGVKLQERPRRDERDTAYWNPAVRTDATGHARVSFVVPDALTRWRLTARAVGQGAADGLVGEKRAYFVSDKPFYIKWTAPNWQRVGDNATLSLAVFNQTGATAHVELSLQTEGPSTPLQTQSQTQSLSLTPGANFASFTLPAQSQSTVVKTRLTQQGKVQDALQTRLSVLPVAWHSARQAWVDVPAGQSSVALALPADASNIRVQAVGEGAAAWSQVADSLIDYPYGCVEQTASRLIPLSLALRAQSAPQANTEPLRARLFSARLRLASMAGPNAVFGWWGQGAQDSLFLSAYAYYADHMAAQTLGLSLPASHWEHLIELYTQLHAQESLSSRALALWMMHDMGLPTATLTSGLLDDLQASNLAPRAPRAGGSWILGSEPHAPEQQAVAVLLAAELARADQLPWPAKLDGALAQTRQVLQASPQLFAQAALVMAGVTKADAPTVQQALQQAADTDPTVDRALALVWWAQATGFKGAALGKPALQWVDKTAKSWRAQSSPSGAPLWQWGGEAVPSELKFEASNVSRSLSVTYSSATEKVANEKTVTLAASLTRKLYRLERTGDKYKKIAVSAGDAFSATELYLDEITLEATKPLRYALLEVPLPPSATMEPSTWGINLDAPTQGKAASAPKSQDPDSAIERAVGVASQLGYTVGVDELQGSRVVRHLVRFGQKGSFVLPRARLWRMYQPDGKALEAGSATQRWKVE